MHYCRECCHRFMWESAGITINMNNIYACELCNIKFKYPLEQSVISDNIMRMMLEYVAFLSNRYGEKKAKEMILDLFTEK